MEMKTLWNFTSMLFLIIGCINSPTGPNHSIQIDRVSWVFVNYPPDYFPSYSHFLGIEGSIHYTGSIITASDGDSVKFSNDHALWKKSITATNLNDSLSLISYSGWDDLLSSNGSVMVIDTYNFEIKLANGITGKFQKKFPAPGMKTTDGYKYIYTEDYNDQILPTFTSMIKRATGMTGIKNDDTITIIFSINDSLVFNGYIWFYNDTNGYVGISRDFRNTNTKAIRGIINRGTGIYSNGTIDTVQISSNEFAPYKGSLYSNIRFARVVLTDGKQYQTDPSSGYDCKSISPIFPIQ